MDSAYLIGGVRTAFGRYGKALAGQRPDDLAALVVRQTVDRYAADNAVDAVVMGNANGAGEENRNVARMAVLLAGLPTTVPANTVNRLCASGLDAVVLAAREIETGDSAAVVAGGVESMTRAPWVMLKPDRPHVPGDATLVSTSLGWRLVNPAMPREWTVSNGEANEVVAQRYHVTREAQDEFALRSHLAAAAAWATGFYADQVVPVAGLAMDENVRPNATLDELAGLTPSFRADGTITAGNASPLSDGAAAILVTSASRATEFGHEPHMRLAARTSVADDPVMFGVAPIAAANQALARAGITWSQVGAVELNEAFAAQSVACVRAWDIDPQAVNAMGGAIALGHPLGASGVRLVLTLIERMRRDQVRWGVATICIGVGQAMAVVIENESV